MKRLIFILAFFTSLLSFGQTPDYFANNPSWECQSYTSDPDTGEEIQKYNYYLKGDTIISGNNYHKIFKKGGEEYFNGTETIFEIQYNYDIQKYIRQDGKSIQLVKGGNTQEELLISYDYQIGDTIKGSFLDDGSGCIYNDTVQKIDSTQIGNNYHKRFFIDSTYGPVLIEGIGNRSQLDSNDEVGGGMGDIFFSPGCEGIGFSSNINCYGQNGESLWGYGNCNLQLVISEKEKSQLSLYPNPTTNFITVTSEKNSKLVLIDIHGKELLIKDNVIGYIEIDLTIFPKGIYFLRSNNSIHKVVKL